MYCRAWIFISQPKVCCQSRARQWKSSWEAAGSSWPTIRRPLYCTFDCL